MTSPAHNWGYAAFTVVLLSVVVGMQLYLDYREERRQAIDAERRAADAAAQFKQQKAEAVLFVLAQEDARIDACAAGQQEMCFDPWVPLDTRDATYVAIVQRYPGMTPEVVEVFTQMVWGREIKP